MLHRAPAHIHPHSTVLTARCICRSSCSYKDCSDKPISRGSLRIGKTVPAITGGGGSGSSGGGGGAGSTDEAPIDGDSAAAGKEYTMVHWHHPLCFFQHVNPRATKHVCSSVTQLLGIEALRADDQATLRKLVDQSLITRAAGSSGKSSGAKPALFSSSTGGGKQTTLFSFGSKASGSAQPKAAGSSTSSFSATSTPAAPPPPPALSGKQGPKFADWCAVLERVAGTSGLLDKQTLLSHYFQDIAAAALARGADPAAALLPAVRLSLAKEDKRTYGLKDKQLGALLPDVLGVAGDRFREAAKTSGDITATAALVYAEAAGQQDAGQNGNTGGDAEDEQQPAAKRPRVEGAADAGASSSGSGRAASASGGGKAGPAAQSHRRRGLHPPAQSTLTLAEVDEWLSKLSGVSRDVELRSALAAIVPRCSPRELQWLLRLVRHDLRIGAQTSIVMSALGPGAAEAYKHGADITAVVHAHAAALSEGLGGGSGGTGGGGSDSARSASPGARSQAEIHKEEVSLVDEAEDAASVDEAAAVDDEDGAAGQGDETLSTTSCGGAAAAMRVRVGMAVKPMLAQPVKSVEEGWTKGIVNTPLPAASVPEACKGVVQAHKPFTIAEVKYDGNRVQVHYDAGRFTFYSRSLKPMKDDQVADIEKHLPAALASGSSATSSSSGSSGTGHIPSFILDGEVLLVTANGGMLPFSSLGTQERLKYAGAHTCFFAFDILYLAGKSLLGEPLLTRRAALEQLISPIPNRVELSSAFVLYSQEELNTLMKEVFANKLEGLVVKSPAGHYEPDARHWRKCKRDHLGTGMADTADLLVLGSYLGRGAFGGKQSVWLCGVRDKDKQHYLTVAKVGNGMDDAQLERFNAEYPMRRIRSAAEVPSWLRVTSTLVPDFVVTDPATAPVWEVTGFEFTDSKAHTADSISIRFPRLTRERPDKSVDTATSLEQLHALKDASQPSGSSGGGSGGAVTESAASSAASTTTHGQSRAVYAGGIGKQFARNVTATGRAAAEAAAAAAAGAAEADAEIATAAAAKQAAANASQLRMTSFFKKV